LGLLKYHRHYLMVCRVGDFQLRNTAHIIALGAGELLIPLSSARRFGRSNGGHDAAKRS